MRVGVLAWPEGSQTLGSHDTRLHTHIHTCMHMHTYIHTCMHMHMHTYIHTCMHLHT